MDAKTLEKLATKLAKVKAKMDAEIELEAHAKLARQYNKLHREYQRAKYLAAGL